MKYGIFITARMKSTRLPHKVILPIIDKPMIVHMIDRLKLAKQPSLIVMLTSTNPQDDILVDIARNEDVECFRGSEDDVLDRISQGSKHFGVDMVISCTADNPFVDPEYIDKLCDYAIKGNYDFVKVKGLPWGTFSYAIKKEAVEKACSIKNEVDTEVWGAYFTETGLFNCGVLEVSEQELYWPDLRLTVDNPEDFKLIETIFNKLYKPGQVFSLKEITELCRQSPDLLKINENIAQKPGIPIKLK